MKKVLFGGLLACLVLAGAGWVTMQNDDYWFPGTVKVQKSLDVVEAAGLKIEGTAVTSSAAELNALDGFTGTYAQLNSAASGNIALARLTNAIATATGTMITNTCVAADGKTNTYVFVPIGGRYMLHSISTSP